MSNTRHLTHGLSVFLLLAIIFIPSGYAAEKDPLEKYNRAVHSFNDKVDRVTLKPVAKVYNKVLPNRVKKSVGNFFNNLEEIPTFVNDVLQLKFNYALSTAWRFAINTTVGIGGLFDPADYLGIQRKPEDFGLTLAHYGWRESSYFVLPLLGPSTIRDTVALPVNWFTSVYPYLDSPYRYGLTGSMLVSRRAQFLDIERIVDQATLDKYVFTRDAYLQRREFLINQKTSTEEIDPYLEDDFE
ncbi:MAG: hypothetical protein Tsb005_04650 [Gammaproteobacteria bacterium]